MLQSVYNEKNVSYRVLHVTENNWPAVHLNTYVNIRQHFGIRLIWQSSWISLLV